MGVWCRARQGEEPGARTLKAEHLCWLCVSERDPLHQGIIVERAQLKQRDFELDLTSRLGKSQIVTNSTPLNQQVQLAHAAASLHLFTMH